MFDIIIVQKQSKDASHEKTRETLITYLNKINMTFEIMTLDELNAQNISYYHPAIPKLGFHPKKNLVIALGGDGTLLHASHYVGGNVRLLGINSSPQSSVGHTCFLKPDQIEAHLKSIIEDENRFIHIQRLQICFQKSTHLPHHNSPCDPQYSAFEALPLCLNDALICHEHPAATSRIHAKLYNRDKQVETECYKIFSSGVWISTAMGQTAAISSYGFPKEPKDSDVVFVAIREPYFPKNSKSYPKKFQFHNEQKQLKVFSNMRGKGLICVDGPDSSTHFNEGDTVIFNSPHEAVLKLVL